MDPAVVPAFAPETGAFRDGFGERRRIVDPAGNETLEVLCLRDELTSVPSFEFALRERVSRLGGFQHQHFGRVLSVDRVNDHGSTTLAVVSAFTPGVRLADILAVAELQRLPLDISAALCLIRQLVPAVAALHENARDVSHGSIAAERIVIAPSGRLVIVEYVLGSALEQLRFSHERYWKDLRLALPRSAGVPRFDHRADVLQIGIVALSLVLGRPLHEDEYPARIGEVVASAWAISAGGGYEPLPPGLRSWLTRALQLDIRNAFASASEARVELEKVLGDRNSAEGPAALAAFLTQYHACADQIQAADTALEPAPVPAAAPAPVPAPAAAPVAALPVGTAAVAATTRRAVDEVEVVPVPPVTPLVAEPAATITPVEPPRATEERRAEPVRSNPLSEPRESRRWYGLAIAALVVLTAGGILAGRRFSGAVDTGSLSVNTNPSGAQVIVDGQQRGVTPLRLTLKVGEHQMQLRGSGDPRSLSVMISPGAEVSQYIELPKSGSPAGQLHVRTEPAGARVSVDGVARGTTPVTIRNLPPGDHAVVLENDIGSIKQSVTIESGTTASLVVPLAAPEGAPLSGWISVTAPANVEVYENKQLIGSNQSDRLMVAAGAHEIEIVNDALGYRVLRSLQVQPGKVAPIKIDFPKTTIDINAVPWAEVWIDGEKVGDTPIGNFPVTIGPHDVLFRHPDLGDARRTVTVTLKSAARLSVDLRK